jgi:hypothetical protein
MTHSRNSGFVSETPSVTDNSWTTSSYDKSYSCDYIQNMTRKPPIPKNADDPEQSRRFVDAARKAEADETPGSTDQAFDRVVRPRKGKYVGHHSPTSDAPEDG